MQRVLSAAVLLLLAVVALDHHLDVRRRARDAVGGVPYVRVYSTGLGLAPDVALVAQGLTSIWSGDLFLHDAGGGEGLRVATFWNDGELLDFRSFAIPLDTDAVRALAEHCAGQEPGSFLVLALHGSLFVQGERAERLAALADELGAAARPWRDRVASWALVARRGRDGWTPVGEAWSPRRGVSLAVPLAMERDLAPPRILDEEDLSVAPLVALWDGASGGPGTALVRALVLGGGTLDALVVPPPGDPSRPPEPLRWRGIELGDGPRLETSVALGPLAGREDAVTLRALVDGEMVGERRLDREARTEWQRWELDLSPHAGRTVDLELAIAAGGATTGRICWGAPIVVSRAVPEEEGPRGR